MLPTSPIDIEIEYWWLIKYNILKFYLNNVLIVLDL